MISERLRDADLRIVGRFAEASNLTLLAEADGLSCVYKPTAGERPLWDFPTGTLARRERAMAELARLLGWPLVPPSVLRDDGPFGPGLCQLFVESGPDVVVDLVRQVPASWLLVVRGADEAGEQIALVHRDTPALRRLALLDVVANNADRKGGHILCDADGGVWGIDHGLTFHVEDKLRTVLWGFAGQPLGSADAADLRDLMRSWDGAAAAFGQLLSTAEIDAAAARLEALLAAGSYPQPTAGWPRLPWPAL